MLRVAVPAVYRRPVADNFFPGDDAGQRERQGFLRSLCGRSQPKACIMAFETMLMCSRLEGGIEKVGQAGKSQRV